MAAAAALMPPNVRRLLAQQPAKRPSFGEIRHVVVLMQENRSFDHYFGTLAGVRGFDDPEAMKLPDGRTVFRQPDPENPDGYLLPFHLDTHASSAQKIPSTSHAWLVQHEAWNGGKMDRWLPAHRKADGEKGPYVMGYYKRADIPFQFALAEAFTICDAYHCSVFGPTWPKRMCLMTGMIDPEGTGGGPILVNKAPAGGYTWTTYPERLEAAGVSWKVYKQQDSYGCNMLENFSVFQQAASGSALHSKGMRVEPDGQFEYDAMHDQLPLFPGSSQPAFNRSTRITRRRMEPRLWPARSTRLQRTRTSGRRRSSSSTTMRMTGCSTMLRRRSRRKERQRSLWMVFPLAPGSACPASSCRRGPRAVGCAASRLITHRYLVFWKSSLVSASRTSARGGEVRSAI